MTPTEETSDPNREASSSGPRTLEILRRRFLAGLITIIPALFTIWIVSVSIRLLNRTLGNRLRPQVISFLDALNLPAQMAGGLTIAMTLCIMALFVLCVGILTRFLLIRRLIGVGENLVNRIPLIRFFYQTPKEVINILTTRKREIKRLVLIEYPRPGVWAFAYVTGETINQTDDTPMVSVFMPSTPNPTTGFFMLVPASEVRDVNIPMEDAVRMIISAGILSPNHYHTAPFCGIGSTPDLPPPEPLTTEPPPEFASREVRQPDEDVADSKDEKQRQIS